MEIAISVIILVFVAAVLALLVRQFFLVKPEPIDLSPIQSKIDTLQSLQERTDRSVRDEISAFRTEMQAQICNDRETLNNTLIAFSDSLQARIAETSQLQATYLEKASTQLRQMTESNERKMEAVRQTVDERLNQIKEDNSKQLDRMRETVDEKLHNTLEKRLGESFRQVSERLEQVHQGLGDMRNLATGVGDLKRALTNVKTRGTWGEVQLGALLEEMLSVEQYSRNVKLRDDSNDFVEYAIKLPGQGEDDAIPLWIPVDAKFPVEDYHRLLEAQDKSDTAGIEEATKLIESRIKSEAKDIFKKYIAPPKTTDFGIMFLPSEGLYAEIIRRSQLVQLIQRDYHVVITGPSTFAAFLSSLQMGFRSLAIHKRTSEVWRVLGEVKAGFGRFGDTLEAVHKRLEQATNSIEDAQKKTRTIQSKLRSVQELPAGVDLTSEPDKLPADTKEE